MRSILISILLLLVALPAFCQVDRSELRAGNRKFKKDEFKAAEIDYRRAVLKDSTSVAAQYNLASSLYRQEDYESAGKALESVREMPDLGADYHFNAGDVALQKKDYASAVQSFRQSLLLNPSDLDAKENYIYAKKMLENQQNQDNQQQQDQNQDQDQDQDEQEQPQDQQPEPQDQDGNDDQQQPEPQPQQGISKQQAQQMLNAIQAREKETQDKVNKEKAELLKSKQKEKNW